MIKTSATSLSLFLAISLLAGCSSLNSFISSFESPSSTSKNPTSGSLPTSETTEVSESTPSSSAELGSAIGNENKEPGKGASIQVVAEPQSVTVLVNKQFALPENYEPADLVYPDVPFVFSQKIEKRLMRKDAAEALEKLFAGAKKDGVYLSGVSAYRSYTTQKALFEHYAAKDGAEKARTYSAMPGTSEHETGLAVDVTGQDGKCAAEDCFGGSEEALWLAKYAPQYGFIIRYPQGKEAITGYQYEPWHLRFVGTKTAKEITEKGITLEEYLNATPVSAP